MKQYSVAFADFRHAHIFDLYTRVKDHPRFRLVATCEENEADSLLTSWGIKPDFTSFDTMLESVPCDVVALGGCFGDRGRLAIKALRAGRHVISDKPLCTTLGELEAIEKAVWDHGGKLGLMLDMRDQANLRALREVIARGDLGLIQTISATGQHPLMRETRPGWYFEHGKHGGTINDIAVHLTDLAPWLADSAIESVIAARTWNGKAGFAPHFKDCAQFMLRLASGAGVMGDVSYLAPDGCGYKSPAYWRITVHGTRGMAETSLNRPGVTLATDPDSEVRTLQAGSGRPGGYLEDFLNEIDGVQKPRALGTSSILESSRWALQTQAAAL